MTKNVILAAIGRLPQDLAVLERAVEVSMASRSDLQVVHVLDLDGHAANLDDTTTFVGLAASATRERVEAALTKLGADPSTIKIHIKLGAHALALIDLCKDLSPKLVVMRAHQGMKITKKLLGSTTDRVIAGAQTPVLVVKQPVTDRYRRAVLATNGADNARDRLNFVSNLLPDTKLQLVQAVQIPPQLKEAMLRVGSRKAELTAHQSKLIQNAEDHLRDLTGKEGPRVTSQVLTGDPAKTLTRLCREQGVDLIALGQGRTSLITRAFIGSVSRRLLRDAACDVIVY